MNSQIADAVLMVRPGQFYRNEETAVNNFFQNEVEDKSRAEIQKLALQEFDQLVEKLRENHIYVEVFEDKASSETPDAIFPNNWLTMHEDGIIITYPMYAENRRKERKDEIVKLLNNKFYIQKIAPLIDYERENQFLEGTGSLILDRKHRIAYAAISERTSTKVLKGFCESFDYSPVAFHAYQTVNDKRLPIYHTNVLMAVGENFAVICLDAIDDVQEKKKVVASMKITEKEVIAITEKQMENFAGNILQLRNAKGHPVIVMSTAAAQSFTPSQIAILKKHGTIVDAPVPTIEKYGGGGVRCMLAEIFLPAKTLKSKT